MMKPYPSYKDSGIEWIGEIPSNWQVNRAKYVFKEIKDFSEDGSETLLSVSEYYGVAPRQDVIDEGDHLTRADSLEGYKKCLKNDLIINIMLAWKRGLGITNWDGIVSPSYAVFRCFSDSDPRYLHHLLRTDLYISEFKRNSTGVIDSRLRLYPEELLRINMITPPHTEQKSIASFLDHKTHQIDTLLEKKQRQTELLKEQRIAIINHAVTKGLDPNVKMKDSGIEWIGEIPEHWGVRKLKYTDYVEMGQSPSSEDYNIENTGLPFLQGNADFTELHPKPRIWCDTAHKIAKTGDILLSVRAPIGAVNIADQNYGIGRGLCAIRAIKSFENFLYYIIVSMNDELNSIGTGSTYTAISVDDIRSVFTPQPPYPEQQSIATHLDIKINEIDDLIKKEEHSIELLKEYRTVLISEVVTGKTDVRNEALA